MFSKPYDPNNYINKYKNEFWTSQVKYFHRNYERILRKIVEYKFVKSNFVFIISTMRSGSTLLNHILAQNNKFISIGESQTVYHNSTDLKILMLKTHYYYKFAVFKNKTYIEKSIHNHQIGTLDFINFNQINKIIFLIRDPIGTISSLLETNFPHSDNINTASNYYKKRIQHILQLSDVIQKSDRGIVITYDDLINNSKITLSVLSKFLNLDQMLSSNYKMQKWSAEWGKGDVGSKKIITGIIDKTPRKKSIKISRSLRINLENIYLKVVQSLQHKHHSIP